ncbi:MAG: hypothetical protein CVT49_11610 [candidate division Zixibacteria bacterium HGW-Zixibacteria-1]|nr:MAG: hypothetical protein CVT49_11610 [candidate division Zixibacteria bacterium HGW-Zixibacteria-1]
MPHKITIHDYITPIKEILAGNSADKKQKLHKLIYSLRKVNNHHLEKRYNVDQTVAKLLEPNWRAKIRKFDPAEWQAAAIDIYKRAVRLLGKVTPPEIILFPGFGAFNGRVYKLDHRPVIGCSPDFPGTVGNNLMVLLAHEYGHYIRWHKTGIRNDKGPIYLFIYEEGFATWLSTKLLPEYDLNHLFMANLHKSINMPNPKGGYFAWCRKNLPELISESQKALRSWDRSDLGRFFQCLRYKDDTTPIRTGYYLGYRLIEMLSEEISPRKMLTIKPTAKMISGWLEEL